MNGDRARTYLDSLSLHGIRPGLERMEALMAALGHPERAFRSVHVTGTNGKGSVCALIESSLRQARYRTGLYTSPHLLHVRERIRVNGHPVSEREFAKTLDAVRRSQRKVKALRGLTYFEATTAAAFLHFADRGVQIAVVEVGLGGRWDATNVLPPPEVCVITNVDLEHQQYLGRTVKKIAREKAGILKPGTPCLTGASAPARAVIARRANELGIRVYGNAPQPGLERFVRASALQGAFQRVNVNLALAALRLLRERGWNVSDRQALSGFRRVSWPARFEHFWLRTRTSKIRVVLDGAHNPAATRALALSLRRAGWAKKPCLLLFNALQDKNVTGMIQSLSGLKLSGLWVPRLETERAYAPEAMADLWPSTVPTRTFPSFEAMTSDLDSADFFKRHSWILATGSLYLAGGFLSRFKSRLSRVRLKGIR